MEAKREQSKTLDWSYRLSPEDLKRLESLLKKLFPTIIWACRATDGSTLKSANLDDILTLTNRDEDRIRSLGVTGFGENVYKEFMSIDFLGSGGTRFSIVHDPDKTRELQNLLRHFCLDIKPAYSVVSDLHGLRKWFLFGLSFVLGLALIILYSNGREVFNVKPTLKEYAWGTLLLNIPGFFSVAGNKIFPRASYLIGAGKARDETTSWLRNCVLWGFFAAVIGGAITSFFV